MTISYSRIVCHMPEGECLLGQPILLLYNLARHEYCYSSLPIKSATGHLILSKKFFPIVTISASQIVREYFADTANKLFVARTIRTGQKNSNHARNRQNLLPVPLKPLRNMLQICSMELIHETNLFKKKNLVTLSL
jgi:hypothetical protein